MNPPELIPFDYSEVYKDLKDKFAEKGYDSFYDGSNIANLISILAYSISSLNINTAVNLNEMLITKASKRKNIIESALMFGYYPTYKLSESYVLTLKVLKTGIVNIPKFTNFECQGKNFVYLGENIQLNSNINDTIEISVKEGVIQKFTDYPDILTYTTKYDIEYFDIPLRNIENDGIFLYVDLFNENGVFSENVEFTKQTNNENFDNNKFIRIDNENTETPRIYFKYGGFGKKLNKFSKLYYNILISSGEKGILDQNELKFSILDIKLADICEVKDVKIIQRGQAYEDLDTIKQEAIKIYNTKYRAVTKYDYETICNSFHNVKSSSIWGGDEEFEQMKGVVFYSCVPYHEQNFKSLTRISKNIETKNVIYSNIESNENLDFIDDNYNSNLWWFQNSEFKNSENNGILDKIAEYKMPAIQDIVINPTFLDTELFIDVKNYPQGFTKDETRKMIFNVCKNYFTNEFGKKFIKSELIHLIESEFKDHIAFEVDANFSITTNELMNVKTNYIGSDENALSYEFTKNIENYEFKVKLTEKSNFDDVITLQFNKLAYYKDENGDSVPKNIFTLKIDENIGSEKIIKQQFYENSDTRLENLGCKIITQNKENYNGENITDAIVGKTLYYTYSILKQTSEVYILLSDFIKVGNYIEIYAESKNKNSEIVFSKILTSSDIKNGYLIFDELLKGEFAGISKPTSYDVKIFESEKLKNEIAIAEYCSSKYQCEVKRNSDFNLFDGNNNSNLYFKYLTENNKIKFIVYLPSNIQAGDELTFFKNYISLISLNPDNTGFEFNGNYYNTNIFSENLKSILLTNENIESGIVEIELENNDLKIEMINYNGSNDLYFSETGENISKLRDISNDNFQIFNSTEKINEVAFFNPKDIYSNEESVNSEYNFKCYVGFKNIFDIRNCVKNYENAMISAFVTPPELDENDEPIYDENSKLYPYFSIDGYKITFENIPPSISNGYINVTINDQIHTFNVFNYRVDYENYNNVRGGKYIYLSLPYENIFDENGKLIKERLPRLEFENNYILDLSINSDNFHEILPSDDFTYDDFDSMNFSGSDYLKFKIEGYVGIVGYYILSNSKNYILLRLNNNFNNVRFNIFYPSLNIETIKNTILKLKSVHFDCDF